MVSIRPATPRDVPTVRETARESWHAAYDAFLGADTVAETVDEWYARDALEQSVADARERDDAAFLVAEDDHGRLVGFVHVVPWPDDPLVASLLRIYVRPDSWGEGAGTALLESLAADLESAFDRLRLVVLAENEVGVSFYESRSFERVETRESEFEGLEESVYERPL